MKPQINIFDKNFMPWGDCSTGIKQPRSFEYVTNRTEWDGITIFTDLCYDQVKKVNSRIKIAWQVESPAFHQASFDLAMRTLYDEFDYVFTYDEELAKTDPDKVKVVNFGGTTVINPRLDLQKSGICAVHSGKQLTANHELRKAVISLPMVNGYGRGTDRPFDRIEDVYSHYKYAVVIENHNCRNYFTEKITDAFACGCIPLYNGCTNINDYFDVQYTWRTLPELEQLLVRLSVNMDFPNILIENYTKVIAHYWTNEDWLWHNYLEAIYNDTQA